MAPEDFIYLNRKGREIHREENDEPDRTFIVKTTDKQSELYTKEQIDRGEAPAVSGISKEAAKMTEREISKGNITGDHMNNVVEIENTSTMKDMYGNVTGDNGRGGTSDANNRIWWYGR